MKLIFKLFSVVLYIFLVSSCGSDKEELVIPNDVIDKDKFSSILADVLVLEGYKSRIYKSKDSLNFTMRSFYKGVLDKHGTDKEIYDKSFLFYSEHPDVMYEVFQMAETKFKMKEDQLNDEKKNAKLLDEEVVLEEDDADIEIDSIAVDSLDNNITDSTRRNNLLNLGKK